MEGIADFLDSLVGGVDLICYSLAIGGLLWGLFVIRPWEEKVDSNASVQSILADKAISLIYKGAFALALIQLLKIVLKVWLMAAILDKWPFPEFAATTQFIGGFIRMALALLLGIVAYAYLRHHAISREHWLNTAKVAALLIISGAWLVHAAGRFDYRILLMGLTTAHQVAAAAWVGGIFQLISVWLLTQQKQIPEGIWPECLHRFSRLGMWAVAGILVSGVPMALSYITSLDGFFGTGYGNILMVKMLLMAMALGFAWLNRSAVLE